MVKEKKEEEKLSVGVCLIGMGTILILLFIYTTSLL